MNIQELPMHRAEPPHWAKPGTEYFRAYVPPSAMYELDWLNVAKCAMQRRNNAIPDWRHVDREQQSVACCVSLLDSDPDRYARARQ